MNKSDAEIAGQALNILDRDGWNKGALTNNFPSNYHRNDYPIGSHCIGGAVNLAYSETADCLWTEKLQDFYKHMFEKIRELYPEYHYYTNVDDYTGCIILIAWWNNHRDTTEDMVRTVLEKIRAE